MKITTALLTIITLGLLFTSCKKEPIEKPKTMITLEVECIACAIVFNTEYEKQTVFRVFQKGTYSFELHKIDTLSVNAITGATNGLHQTVKIDIKANKKLIDTRSFAGYAIDQKYDVSLTKFK
jgi:hypothetical protein